MDTYAFAVIAASEKPLNPNDVRPGYLALAIVLIMCLATYFLIRSFLKHSRRADQPWEGDAKAAQEKAPQDSRPSSTR